MNMRSANILAGIILASSVTFDTMPRAFAHEGCASDAAASVDAKPTPPARQALSQALSQATRPVQPAAKGATRAQAAKPQRAAVAPLDLAPAIADIKTYAMVALAVPTGIPEEVEIQIPIDGRLETVRLFRTSLRNASCRLLVDRGDGRLVEEPLPPHRTYRGSVLSNGLAVSASIIDGKLTAMIPTDDDTIWVQPSSDFFAGRAANEHVVYRRSELVPSAGYRCGVDEAGLGLPDWMRGAPNDPAESNGSMGGGSGAAGMPGGGDGDGGVAGLTPNVAKIAFDADFEFFQKNGSNLTATVNDIETVMNNVTFVYDRDVNISYDYSAFVVRTSSSQPYTTTVMTDLLCQFRTKWNALPESEILRDVAQLFTGKTIQGNTIGLAWLGVVCNQQGNDCGAFGNLAYSAVESRFTTTADFRTSLSAHEIGHNWQAQHCDGASPCNIMCSIINSCSGTTGVNLKFSAGEQTQIINYRNSVSCDAVLPAPLAIPFSDTFEALSVNVNNWIYNKGGALSTAALNEPSPTRSLNLNSQSANDYGDDEIRSNFILLGGQSAGTVGYFVQRNNVESGKQLVVEYFNNLLKWQALNTITSDGINQTTFTEYTTRCRRTRSTTSSGCASARSATRPTTTGTSTTSRWSRS